MRHKRLHIPLCLHRITDLCFFSSPEEKASPLLDLVIGQLCMSEAAMVYSADLNRHMHNFGSVRVVLAIRSTTTASPTNLHLPLQENVVRGTGTIPTRGAYGAMGREGALLGLSFCLPLRAQVPDPQAAGAPPASRIAGRADHPGWLLTRKPGTQTAGSEARAGGIPRFAWRAAPGVPISQYAIGPSPDRSPYGTPSKPNIWLHSLTWTSCTQSISKNG